MSHPFTESTLSVAARLLDNAIAKLEEYADTCGAGVRDPHGLFSSGYGDLLKMRGAFAAAQQLEQLTEEVAKADTQPAPKLTVVR